MGIVIQNRNSLFKCPRWSYHPKFRVFTENAIRAHHPSHAISATQRAWLAFCVTAVLVTNSICGARFERARLGTYALAALSWMFRHSNLHMGVTKAPVCNHPPQWRAFL